MKHQMQTPYLPADTKGNSGLFVRQCIIQLYIQVAKQNYPCVHAFRQQLSIKHTSYTVSCYSSLETFEGFASMFVENRGDKCIVILPKSNEVISKGILNFFLMRAMNVLVWFYQQLDPSLQIGSPSRFRQTRITANFSYLYLKLLNFL